ncbi:acyl-CoA dehydrogenase [Nocardia sp. NPDC004168]|uniref:acyl-CoA dehydrogenase n=1 Tax=Nocardia sp. NPDC004168 TaxID=3154452 RepID=UPI0033AE05EC
MDEPEDAVAEAVVSLLECESERDINLWPKLAERGLLSVPLPHHYGDGLGILGLSAILIELATDAVQVPALTTLGFGVLPLVGAVPESLAQDVFPAVAQGAVLTAALSEPGQPFTAQPETVADRVGGRVRIEGIKVSVPYADLARWMLVPTSSGIAIVEMDTSGVTCIQSSYSSSAPEYSVYFDKVMIPEVQIISIDVSKLLHLALASMGSVAVGLLRGMLLMLTELARVRRRFGMADSDFRAVMPGLKDIHVISGRIEFASRLVTHIVAQGEDCIDGRIMGTHLNALNDCISVQLPAAVSQGYTFGELMSTDSRLTFDRYLEQAEDLVRWLRGVRVDRS